MADRLDAARPYGQIFNDDQGRFYEQDGQYFTAGGDLWTAPVDPAAAPKGKKAAGTQLDAQLADPAPAPEVQP